MQKILRRAGVCCILYGQLLVQHGSLFKYQACNHGVNIQGTKSARTLHNSLLFSFTSTSPAAWLLTISASEWQWLLYWEKNFYHLTGSSFSRSQLIFLPFLRLPGKTLMNVTATLPLASWWQSPWVNAYCNKTGHTLIKQKETKKTSSAIHQTQVAAIQWKPHAAQHNRLVLHVGACNVWHVWLYPQEKSSYGFCWGTIWTDHTTAEPLL